MHISDEPDGPARTVLRAGGTEGETFYDPTKIKAARRSTGLKQNAFAKRIGISAAHLCNIENGKVKEPGADILALIAEAAGWTVADLERHPIRRAAV